MYHFRIVHHNQSDYDNWSFPVFVTSSFWVSWSSGLLFCCHFSKEKSSLWQFRENRTAFYLYKWFYKLTSYSIFPFVVRGVCDTAVKSEDFIIDFSFVAKQRHLTVWHLTSIVICKLNCYSVLIKMDLGGSPITLVIKAPNQRLEDQTVECMLGWTVKKLKKHLENVYPSKPVSHGSTLNYPRYLRLS